MAIGGTSRGVGTPLRSRIDTRSDDYRANLATMQGLWDDEEMFQRQSRAARQRAAHCFNTQIYYDNLIISRNCITSCGQ